MTDPKKPQGIKWDHGKPRFGLVPALIEAEVAKVLTVGANKYAVDNWKYVPDGKARYIDALGRHINAYRQGEIHDPDDGLHHLAHAICCAMFIAEADLSGVPLAPPTDKETQELSATKPDNGS